jgi:hypothetical protein
MFRYESRVRQVSLCGLEGSSMETVRLHFNDIVTAWTLGGAGSRRDRAWRRCVCISMILYGVNPRWGRECVKGIVRCEERDMFFQSWPRHVCDVYFDHQEGWKCYGSRRRGGLWFGPIQNTKQTTHNAQHTTQRMRTGGSRGIWTGFSYDTNTLTVRQDGSLSPYH